MPLQRCRDCNATLKAEETVCWACGSAVEPKDVPFSLNRRFSGFINFLFIVSLLITIASLFTDMMPPFMRCATVTAVLFLVKSSATQMLDKERKKS
jgi:hypothetical protein